MGPNVAPDGDDDDLPEPPRIRNLRLMTLALQAVLMICIVVIAGTLVFAVLRASGPAAPKPVTATEITVPEGLEITSVGGDGTRLFVQVRDASGAEWIRIHDAADGRFLSRIEVVRERLDDSSGGQ